MNRTYTALLSGLIVIFGSMCAHAGPIFSEIKGFQCLMPDWSKTSGGISPALSPDGKTLVYIVQNPGDFEDDQVWVAQVEIRVQYFPDSTKYDPWQMPISRTPLNNGVSPIVCAPGSLGLFRNADWSQDGKKVAFVCHGKLFMAEDINSVSKTAKVRLLADYALVPPESGPPDAPKDVVYAEPALAPRWSPNGKQIAFYRKAPPPGIANQVCVVDVTSGKETVLASDVLNDAQLWEQPWSPDGESLVYSCNKSTSDGSAVADGLKIISVRGGKSRHIFQGDEILSPSWSPKGDRIAFTGPNKSGAIVAPVKCISRIDGSNKVVIAPVTLSPDALAAAHIEMRDRLVKLLKERFPNALTAVQLAKLSRRTITEQEVGDIITAAIGKKERTTFGSELQKVAENELKRWPWAVNGKEKRAHSSGIHKVLDALPADKSQKFHSMFSEYMIDVLKPVFSLRRTVDAFSAWSPDGKRLAFVRMDMLNAMMRLMVADVATRKAVAVFESGSISSLSWTANGNSIVLLAKRDLVYKGKVVKEGRPWPELITVPSYPEIWQIEVGD